MISGNTLGVDYHDRVLQVCVMTEQGEVLTNRRIVNEFSEVEQVIARFSPVKSVVAEACVGSAEFLDELRRRKAVAVKLCHPGYANRMRYNPDKSDKSDGELLADLERVGYLPEVWLAPEWIRELRTVLRYRYSLVKQNRDTKLRIRSILRQHRMHCKELKRIWGPKGREWLEKIAAALPEGTSWVLSQHLEMLDSLKKKLLSVEKRLETSLKEDNLYRWLLEQRGVGKISAATLRIEIGSFSRFKTGKQLARFCGVTPRNASSGMRMADAGLIKAGNPELRAVIIEMAHCLILHDSYWKAFAARHRQAGKPYCVVVAAVANRWLRKAFHSAVLVEQNSESTLLAA